MVWYMVDAHARRYYPVSPSHFITKMTSPSHFTEKMATPPRHVIVNGLHVSKIVSQAQVDSIKDLELFPDDTWIVTFPKAGTTWTQQIVRLILSNGRDDGRKLNEAVPWIEAANNPDPKLEYNLDVSTLQRPRAFKSHFTYDLMPCGVPSTTPCKYIYISRNPKDLAVSYYHHYHGFKYVEGKVEWSDFISWFLSGDTIYGDYFDHVLSWWRHRHEQNILFIKFEDLKKNPTSSIGQIAQFMGYELSDDLVSLIAEKTNFDAMKDDPGSNYGWANHRKAPGFRFMRKGMVGNWTEYFSEEESAKCDAIYKEKLKSEGLEFDFS